MGLLVRLAVLHGGRGVFPADGPVLGVAEVDVAGEAVVRVLEARAGLALGEAEAEGGGLFALLSLSSKQEARVAGEVDPLGAPGPEVGQLLGHHAVEVEAGYRLVGVVVVDQGDAGALEEREDLAAKEGGGLLLVGNLEVNEGQQGVDDDDVRRARAVEQLLDDIDVGDLEGRSIAEYRAWKREHRRGDRGDRPRREGSGSRVGRFREGRDRCYGRMARGQGAGRRERKGLRSFSVSGRVKKPGVVLAPAGVTARELDMAKKLIADMFDTYRTFEWVKAETTKLAQALKDVDKE